MNWPTAHTLRFLVKEHTCQLLRQDEWTDEHWGGLRDACRINGWMDGHKMGGWMDGWMQNEVINKGGRMDGMTLEFRMDVLSTF